MNNNSKNNIVKWIIFFTPLLFLGQTYYIILIRLLIYTFLLAYTLHKTKSIYMRCYYPIILLLISGLYFAWRTHHIIGYLPSLELSYCLYALTISKVFSDNEKKKLVSQLCKGMLFAGVLGFGYMILTNNYIKGGTYTENELNISNLTVPIYLSIYIIYCTLKNSFENKWSKIDIIKIISILPIILFLEKRGPTLFLLLVLVPFLFKPICRYYLRFSKVILIVLFLFPLYQLPLTEYIIETGYIEEYFERSDDFSDLDANPRITRLLAASEFISDFQISDLFGYHDVIQLSKVDDDLAHEHFHNTFLQFYYERGLLAIILFAIFIFYMRTRTPLDKYYCISHAVLLYLMLVGTNEDMLMTGSLYEIIIYYLILFNIKKPLKWGKLNN